MQSELRTVNAVNEIGMSHFLSDVHVSKVLIPHVFVYTIQCICLVQHEHGVKHGGMLPLKFNGLFDQL